MGPNCRVAAPPRGDGAMWFRQRCIYVQGAARGGEDIERRREEAWMRAGIKAEGASDQEKGEKERGSGRQTVAISLGQEAQRGPKTEDGVRRWRRRQRPIALQAFIINAMNRNRGG
jgi:hypothetical protein